MFAVTGPVVLEGEGWRSPPVQIAVGFGARLRGLRHDSTGGILLWGRSVHGIGMSRPLQVIRLDRTGAVDHRVRVLRPGRLVVFPHPGWILELPAAWPSPPPGAGLFLRPILGGCPAD